MSQTWGHTHAVPAVGRWEQEGRGFKLILTYVVNYRPIWTIWEPTPQPKKDHKTNSHADG